MKKSGILLQVLIAATMGLHGARVLANIPLPAPAKKDTGNAQAPVESGAVRELTNNGIKQTTDGRIELPQSGLSLMPPPGWKTRDNMPGLSLVLESPEEKNSRYRRTIQVRTGTGPRFFDSIGIKDFEEELVEKLGNQNNNVNEFSIRNSEIVKTDDGRQALLTYASFSLNGFDMIQAHLVISNMEQHTVLTYTDLAESFEDNSATSPLGVAWAAMSSARFLGQQPERFAGPIQIAALAGIVLVILSIVITFRSAMARRALAREADQALNGKPIEVDGGDSNPGNLLSGDVITLNPSPSNLGSEQTASLHSMEQKLDRVA